MESTLKKILKQLKINESTISTILGALVVVVVGVLLFNFFSKSQEGQIGEEAVVTEEVTKIGQEGTTPEGLPVTHKVEKGEHLWKIAEKYYGSGYNWVDIVKENDLRNPDGLLIGTELKIPSVATRKLTREPTVAGAEVEGMAAIESDKYKVQEGDSLWKIAVRAYGDGYKWPEIARANSLSNPDHIVPDQELTIPR